MLDTSSSNRTGSVAIDPRRVAIASAIGTTIEWYDFFIYGTAAAVVFGPQFFPRVSALAGTLAAFATFAVGFIARPLGGIVMGHFGDRLGRKSMLVWSLMLMGLWKLCRARTAGRDHPVEPGVSHRFDRRHACTVLRLGLADTIPRKRRARAGRPVRTCRPAREPGVRGGSEGGLAFR